MGMVWLAKNDTSFSALRGPNHDPSTAFSTSATSASRNLDCGSLIVETTIDQENPISAPPITLRNVGAAKLPVFALDRQRRQHHSAFAAWGCLLPPSHQRRQHSDANATADHIFMGCSKQHSTFVGRDPRERIPEPSRKQHTRADADGNY